MCFTNRRKIVDRCINSGSLAILAAWGRAVEIKRDRPLRRPQTYLIFQGGDRSGSASTPYEPIDAVADCDERKPATGEWPGYAAVVWIIGIVPAVLIPIVISWIG